MDTPEVIVSRLREHLSAESVEIEDQSHLHAGHAGARPEGETHFRVQIIAEAFAGKSRVDRQRAINRVLAEELAGPVHALGIDARPPEEG